MRVLLIVLPMVILMVGCGGWTVSKARRTVELSAMAVEGADETLASLYNRKLDQLEQRVEQGDITRSEYDEEISPYEIAKTAVVTLRGAHRDQGDRGLLDSAERAIDVWEISGEDGSWTSTVPCLVMALVGLKDAMDEIGVSVYEIDYAVSFAQNWAEGMCRNQTGESSSQRHGPTLGTVEAQ